MRPEDDPGWASYAETVLVFHADPVLEVPLSRPVAPTLGDSLARIGLGGPFGLVTPCNPRGQRGGDDSNAMRLREFLQRLDARGARYVRVDGVSPDRLHIEPGVALAWPQEEVVAVAREWEQSAIYWWDGMRFWVIGALTDTPPWPLEGGG